MALPSCFISNDSKQFAVTTGTISRVDVAVYDFAIQLPKGPPVLSKWDRPLYSQLRQTALFKGSSDYEWWALGL